MNVNNKTNKIILLFILWLFPSCLDNKLSSRENVFVDIFFSEQFFKYFQKIMESIRYKKWLEMYVCIVYP